MTPSQHLRQTLETKPAFEEALAQLATGPLINEVYYTMAGGGSGEGAVVTRDRNDGYASSGSVSTEDPKTADVWPINASDSSGNGWFRLQTNYGDDNGTY